MVTEDVAVLRTLANRDRVVRWFETMHLAGQLRGRVLVAGCAGGGYTLTTAWLPNVTHVASLDLLPKDLVHDRVSFAEHVPNGVWHHGDVQDLCMFEDKVFDGVLCYDVLQHVEDAPKALREFARVARELVCLRLHFRKGCSFSVGDDEVGSCGHPFKVWTLWEPDELVDRAGGAGLELAAPIHIDTENGIVALFKVV